MFEKCICRESNILNTKHSNRLHVHQCQAHVKSLGKRKPITVQNVSPACFVIAFCAASNCTVHCQNEMLFDVCGEGDRERKIKKVHSRRRQCLCVLYACTLYRVKPKCSCMPTHTHTNTHTIAHSSPFTSVAIATDGVGLYAQAQVNGVDDDRVIPIAIFNAKASKLFFLPRDFSSKCFSFLSAILPSYK